MQQIWQETRAGAARSMAAPVAGSKPTRREKARDRIRRVLDEQPDAAVIALDAGSAKLLRHLGHSHPDRLLLRDPAKAGPLLRLLTDRGLPWTDSAARSAADPELVPPLPSHVFPDRRGPAARVVSIVGNTVDGDSRVQKTAATLAGLGYESILLGRHPDNRSDAYYYQGALVRRVRVPLTQAAWDSEAPPRSPMTAPAYRTRMQSRAARARAGARSRQASADLARLDSGNGPGAKLSAFKIRLDDRTRRHVTALRKTLHDRNRRDYLRLDPERFADSARTRRRAATNARQEDYPRLLDLELGFGPQLEQLRPDVIHAHDSDMLSLATNAAARLKSIGWHCSVVYDAHEYTPGIARGHARQRAVLEAVERECVPRCDALVTVSDEISGLLAEEHHLSDPPTVIANAPRLERAKDIGDVRDSLRLPPEVPLLVYLGRVAPQRGVDLAVRALVEVPDAHLVVLTPPNRAWSEMESLAARLGTGNRLHRLDYVAVDDVTAFISTADIGLIPFRHLRNSELALPTKFREYLLGGLPMVATDFGAVAAEIRRTGVGELCELEDPASMADAIKRVLADPARYRGRITPGLMSEHSWEAQEAKLARVYAGLTGSAEPATASPNAGPNTVPARARSPLPDPPDRPAVLIGPMNAAGQAAHWAESLQRAGIPATSLQVVRANNPFRFDCDIIIRSDDWRSLEYRLSALLDLVPRHSHVLLDGARPIFALDNSPIPDVELLKRSGRIPGLIFHGSELRSPQRHAVREPWSPFSDPANRELRNQLQAMTQRTHAALVDWFGPTFVSTPDLLDDLPWATWLPVVVDHDTFRPDGRDLRERSVPVVMHAPSRPALKGSRFIEPILHKLDAEGLIRYRRLDRIPHSRMPDMLRSVDIVVDQVLMNLIGVGTAETMASGRVAVAHLSDELADRYPARPPVVDATPDTLEATIRELAADHEQRAELAQRGREFSRLTHDGRMAADILIKTLGLPQPDLSTYSR